METEQISAPPIAEPRPTLIERHGDVRQDDYFWLRERDNPAVIALLEAENAYAQAVMAHTQELQETLFQEMKGRIKESDTSAPVPYGDYIYYERTIQGLNYPIYCRRPVDAEAQEEVLLDVNALAEGHAFCEVGEWQVSPDHKQLAFTLDVEGTEAFVVHAKNLETGELYPERLPNAYYGLAWANDSRTIFYITLDPAHRPDKLFCHTLGKQPADDTVVYVEPDERYFVHLQKTRSGRYLLVSSDSNMTTEVSFIPADAPWTPPTVIAPRRHGHEYRVDHRGEYFYIVTNDDARNFRVVTAPVDTPRRENWQQLLPHSDSRLVDRVDAFQDHLVVYARENGLRTIHILHLAAGGPDIAVSHEVHFPEPLYTYSSAWNPTFAATTVRLVFSSLRTPPTTLVYDMNERTFEVVKQEEIHGYDPDRYETLRLWATAPDGTKVPMSIVHRKGLQLDGSNPAMLYGYGSYGACTDPAFKANRISLLDRGFVFADAHIRGGSEMGRAWYEDGKLLRKTNTFTDFIACAEHLIDAGYTEPQKLVIQGRSAGGLLMGAVTNMRPDLFAAVIAGVPFMDVINTMLDPSVPLTVTEYEEWGDPEDPELYAAMRAYSPYDNLEAKAYPRILATAGLSDPRVQYWEPAKYVAKLRALKTDDRPVLLKTNLAAGHSGASGRYDYLRELAFEYAFLLDAVGISA